MSGIGSILDDCDKKLDDSLCCGNCTKENTKDCEYYYFGVVDSNGCDDFYGTIKPKPWNYCKKHSSDRKSRKDRMYKGEKFRTNKKEGK